MSINKVILAGRITAEPELKSTTSGVSVMKLSIAVDDGYGENKKTYFPNIVVWKHTAEYLSKYANKGDMLVVSGRLTIRNYEKDGEIKYVTEIVAEDVQLFGSTKKNSEVQESTNATTVDDFVDDESDDDLPF